MTSDAETLIARASDGLGSNPAQAERDARAALAQAPVDPRARLILASALRRQGRLTEARPILEGLARSYPKAPLTLYELGLVQEKLGDVEAAEGSLQRAVEHRTDLAEAWRALGELRFRKGDEPGARAAFDQLSRASIKDPALRGAAEALYDGRLAAAERELTALTRKTPDHPEALRLMAETLLRQNRFAEAEAPLTRLLVRDPHHYGARFLLAQALFEQQKAPEALPHLERLLAFDPHEPAYRNLMSASLALVGDFNRVIDLNEALLVDFPLQPRLWLNHGHALRTVGRQAEAVAAYRRALALAPDLGDAYWSLANLKIAALDEADEAAIRVQLARSDLAYDDRLHFHYALGKLLEDRAEDAGAMSAYCEGARLRRAANPYDASVLTEQVHRAKSLFTVDFLATRAEAGHPAPDPIFVVGLPRSGSTLVEQILASHSAVEGVMELPDLGIIADGLDALGDNGAYPEILAALSASDLAALGGLYLDRTRVHRRTDRPRFVDKMPNNFRFLGLILTILPQASIVDVRRHPMAAGFSAFKQHFAQGQSFTYDLTDLGLYYRDYVSLMAHFDTVAPGRIHRVIYEDLVEDTEREVTRLLDGLALPFEASCLRFHDTSRPVRTVSSEQVRRPIYRDGLDQWRRFEAWLDPLKTALGPVLETWRG